MNKINVVRTDRKGLQPNAILKHSSVTKEKITHKKINEHNSHKLIKTYDVYS
jgi:hypothetical protein